MGAANATGNQLRPLLRPWLASLAQRSECTAKNYGVAVGQFLDDLGDRDLTPETLTDWTASLRGLAPSSQAAKISAVRSFLRACQAEGLVERSPVEWLRRPKVEVSPYGKWLQLEELRAMADAARELGPVHEALVTLAWQTGCRVSELAGARWCDLYADPDGRIGLRVMHAKGGRERQVRILPETLARLAVIRRGSNAGSDVLDPADETALIPRLSGRPYTTWSLWKMTKDCAAKAGLTRNVHPHSYRHSHATWAAAGDADVITLMQSLGHRDSATTMVYVGLAKGLASSSALHLPAIG